jgi:hypothetical protein
VFFAYKFGALGCFDIHEPLHLVLSKLHILGHDRYVKNHHFCEREVRGQVNFESQKCL